jgi:outer membrane lipoprotein-sorting protein
MNRARAWYILFALFLFSACATVPVLPPEIPRAEEVLEQVYARRQFLDGLKGLAQTKISSPAKTFSATQVLFARRPGFLRVETLSPFGTPVLYAATDGRDLSIYQPSENRYYRGSFQAGSVSLGLPSNFSASEIVSFLMGGAAPGDYEKVSIREDREKGLWVLELLDAPREESQTLWVDPQFFYVVRAEFHRPRFSYNAEFTDFRQANDILFPRRMLLDSRDAQTRISIEFQELELNPPWHPQDFLLPVPPGVTVSPWP